MSTDATELSRSDCHATPDGLLRAFVSYAATFANHMDPVATKLLNRAAADLMAAMDDQIRQGEARDAKAST
jgi:hypothetical protein